VAALVISWQEWDPALCLEVAADLALEDFLVVLTDRDKTAPVPGAAKKLLLGIHVITLDQ